MIIYVYEDNIQALLRITRQESVTGGKQRQNEKRCRGQLIFQQKKASQKFPLEVEVVYVGIHIYTIKLAYEFLCRSTATIERSLCPSSVIIIVVYPLVTILIVLVNVKIGNRE